MIDDAPSIFSEREFRDALGFFATGIAIVTARFDGASLGATVNSFNAVSLDPPLVLFSIARKASSFAAWHRVGNFVVTILTSKQIGLSNRFAKPGTAKWQDIDAPLGVVGAPLLPQCLARFECVVHDRADGGDHEIIVGRVVSLRIGQPAEEPLIFYRGKYRSLGMEGAPAPHSPDLWLYGW
jgi:flavin reductase (DIM6/NTAB) family NADH-FMN oxidoreductase RutF